MDNQSCSASDILNISFHSSTTPSISSINTVQATVRKQQLATEEHSRHSEAKSDSLFDDSLDSNSENQNTRNIFKYMNHNIEINRVKSEGIAKIGRLPINEFKPKTIKTNMKPVTLPTVSLHSHPGK